MALILYTVPGDIYSSNKDGDLSRYDHQSAYVGLSNQGATCYLNSLLQTLYMTPEFRSAVFTWRYDAQKDASERDCIPLQLQQLFGMLYYGKSKAVDTVALTKSFGWEGSEAFQQQDVQELTRVLFDALEETFKGTEVENIIDDLYAGELIDYIRCINEDYESERVDKFLDLSFAIIPFGTDQSMHSLNECIEMFLKPELLDGENQYFLESVNRKVDAIKGLKFGKLPRIMSCNLKRFVYDFQDGMVSQKKLNDVVRFPMVLDMNRYVATTARAASTRSENDEFELFLLQQMNQLRANSATAAAATDGIACDTGAAVSPSAGDNVGLGSSCVSAALGLYSSDSVESERGSDRNGSEEGLREESKEAQKEESTIFSESIDWTRDQIEELVKARGEWVYELYAVLIHAGAIAGGHYYAYIKDLDTDRWWDFNDCKVSPIDSNRVREAWGAEHSYEKISYATLKRSLNSANAYMLMYRKVACEGSKPVSFPDEDLIPAYIKESTKRAALEAEEKERLAEEARSVMQVDVYWQHEKHIISASKKELYGAFLLRLFNHFNIKASPDFVSKPIALTENGSGTSTAPSLSPSSSSSPSPVLQVLGDNDIYDITSRMRLRYYIVSCNVALEPLDSSTRINDTLDQLGISAYRPVCIETRAAGEEWEEYIYNADGGNVSIKEFDPASRSFLSPVSISLPPRSSAADLYNKVQLQLKRRKWNGLGRSLLLSVNEPSISASVAAYSSTGTATAVAVCPHFRLIKFSPSGLGSGKITVILPNEALLREDHAISQYTFLALEFVTSWAVLPTPDASGNLSTTGSQDETAERYSLAFECFMRDNSTVKLNHNQPPLIALSDSISFDSRRTVGELRSTLAEKLNLPVDQTRILRSSTLGADLKDDTVKLCSLGVYNNSSIFIVRGKTLPVGVFSIKLYRYIPRIKCSFQLHYPTFSSSTKPISNFRSESGYLADDDPEISVDNEPSITYGGGTFGAQRTWGEHVTAEAWQSGFVSSHVDSNGSCGEVVANSIPESPAKPSGLSHILPVDSSAAVCEKQREASIGVSSARSMDTVDFGVDCSTKEGRVDIDEIDVDFGLRTTHASSSEENFHVIDELATCEVSEGMLVSEFRRMIYKKLCDLGLISTGINVTPKHLRIHEMSGNRPEKILRDAKTFAENGVNLYDGKAFCFQVLNHEEELQFDYENGDVIVYVQRWNKGEWALEDCTQVYLRGLSPVSEIADGIGKLVGIPVKNLRALIVPSHTDLPLYGLDRDLPPKASRAWFHPGRDTTLVRYLFTIHAGDLLLVQDSEEPLRQLTAAEKLSVDSSAMHSGGGFDSSSMLGNGYMNSYPYFWGDEDGGNSYCVGDTSNPVLYGPAPFTKESTPTVSFASDLSGTDKGDLKKSTSSAGIRIKIQKGDRSLSTPSPSLDLPVYPITSSPVDTMSPIGDGGIDNTDPSSSGVEARDHNIMTTTTSFDEEIARALAATEDHEIARDGGVNHVFADFI